MTAVVEHVSYILQTYRAKGDRLESANPQACRDEAQGWERAKRALELGHAVGARIIRYESDPPAGEYGEPEILKSFGHVPGPIIDD
jgi:hypothetical protein